MGDVKSDVHAIERKWQERWEEEGIFDVDVHGMDDPFYILTMFPYPSGDRLHIGHWYQYGLMDTWSRFQLLRGKQVFQPMGFDAFGLPAENYAIKQGLHPDDSTTANIEHMIGQYKRMGVSYAWKYMLDSSKPDFYKWTQWLFLQFYSKGLAYRKEAPVNWCPSCQTVLANEQVIDGLCERCDAEVMRKNLRQWFFRITDFAERLLAGLDTLDWPQKTLSMQRNWIGKSEGAQIRFRVRGTEEPILVFTTRPDTLFGATYMTLAPEHSLVSRIAAAEQKAEVDEYIATTATISEVDRLSTSKTKTGVFTGAYAINPVNGEEIPIWISDYVLVTYGTGAVMAVPAHDQRDFEFAEKFDLPVVKVILAPGTKKEDPLDQAYTAEGSLINSGSFDGLENNTAKGKITDQLAKTGDGEATIIYRLRDWLISRQRYWGCPIPIVYCGSCGEVPVPEDQLPVELPFDVEFKPTGESPLAGCESFVETVCPNCSRPARREADTLDTFVCSSWYQFRFPSVGDDEQAFDPVLTEKFLPVSQYAGGAEHACMHLLYARFVTMALHDMGHLSFEEPFPKVVHQGLVLGADGAKISKSKGKAITPDPYVEEYGADILRLYLCFGFNYVDGGPWDDGGFVAVTRFMDKTIRLFEERQSIFSKSHQLQDESPADKDLLRILHNSIKGITQDMERFMFNTSIARLMELYNGIYEFLKAPETDRSNRLLKDVMLTFIRLLAPFAPHYAEEFWQQTGHTESIFKEAWPQFDEKFLLTDTINMAVMINGKLRDQLVVAADASEDEILAAAQSTERIKTLLQGKQLSKHILVKGKLINLIPAS